MDWNPAAMWQIDSTWIGEGETRGLNSEMTMVAIRRWETAVRLSRCCWARMYGGMRYG